METRTVAHAANPHSRRASCSIILRVRLHPLRNGATLHACCCLRLGATSPLVPSLLPVRFLPGLAFISPLLSNLATSLHHFLSTRACRTSQAPRAHAAPIFASIWVCVCVTRVFIFPPSALCDGVVSCVALKTVHASFPRRCPPLDAARARHTSGASNGAQDGASLTHRMISRE